MAAVRRYVAKTLLQDIISAAAFFAAAGRLDAPRGWVYACVSAALTAAGLAVLARVNRAMLAAREARWDDTPAWDRRILPAYLALSFIGVHVAAGLDARRTAPPLDGWLWLGLAIYAAAAALSIWAMASNRHFEPTARLQTDRAQSVCDRGPYSLVRHPGYAAIALGHFATPLIYGSALAAAVCAVVVALIAARTALEDAMLLRGLPGYAKYAARVRSRLIPGVW